MEGRIILYFFFVNKKKTMRCVYIIIHVFFFFCFALSSWRRVLLLAGEGAVQETERCYVNE